MDLKGYLKVELHRHLEGALRFSTLLELSKFPAKNIAEQKAHFLVQTPMKDLVSVLNKFSATQKVLSSTEVLTRIAYEAVEDAYNEGIRILELRYAPTFIMDNHPNLTFAKIHESILQGVALAKKNFPMAVGLICILQRTLPLSVSEKVVDFIIETKNTWVGVDLADNESEFPAKNFANFFAKLHSHNLPITIHAGETNDSASPLNVADAIDLLHARRIGHGLQIINNKQVLEKVITKKIPLELCPTSNWLTNAIASPLAHPIKKLMELGVLCTINSDDPGIFGIDLTNEYSLLHNSYGFDQKTFDRCNDTAAAASFIPLEEKQRYWPRQISL